MKKDALDRRIQRTRKGLHDALVALMLEKRFEKITVQDVIDRANVGRSTFYLHFNGIEDLFLGGFENLWGLFEQHLNGQAMENTSVWDLSLIVFQHAQNYTDVYKALASQWGGHLMSVHMHKYLSVLIQENLKREWPKTTEVPLHLVVYHLTSSLISLLVWWIDHNTPYPPAQMNELYRQLTEPAIKALLK